MFPFVLLWLIVIALLFFPSSSKTNPRPDPVRVTSKVSTVECKGLAGSCSLIGMTATTGAGW